MTFYNVTILLTSKYLWQFPQNLLGIIVIVFTDAQLIKSYKNSKVYHSNRSFKVSLGNYIVVPTWAGIDTLKHEYAIAYSPYISAHFISL